MAKQNEIAWHERHSEWQGEINVIVRELNKNQDVLEKKIEILIIDNAVAIALAKQVGRRWGVIGGIIAAIITALIVHAIINSIG